MWVGFELRVVPKLAILYLKSLSERVGFDIQRHWNWMMNIKIVSKLIEDGIIQIHSRSMSDPTISDIDFTNKMAWVWTTLKISNQDLGWGRVRIDSYHNELSSTLAVCSWTCSNLIYTITNLESNYLSISRCSLWYAISSDTLGMPATHLVFQACQIPKSQHY